MIINWEGRPYGLDFTDLTLHQAEVIEKETGAPVGEFLDATEAGGSQLQMVKLIYWLMLAQNGAEIPVATVDFPLLAFSRAFAEAAQAVAPAPEEAPDPTPGSPSPPASPSPPDLPSQETSPGGEEGALPTV